MKKVFAVIGMVVCCAGLVRAEQTAETDWCKIITPDSVKPGEAVNVSVVVGTIPEGMKVKADLHAKSAAGKYLGFNKPGPSLPAASGETVTFKLMPKAVPDLGALNVTVILTPDGTWANRAKTINSKDVPITTEAPAAPAAQ